MSTETTSTLQTEGKSVAAGVEVGLKEIEFITFFRPVDELALFVGNLPSSVLDTHRPEFEALCASVGLCYEIKILKAEKLKADGTCE